MNTGSPRQLRGFTLIELMTVIAILTVLVVAAAPNLRALIASQRARAAAYELISDLTLARSEAVKRNRDIVLNPLSGWAAGWTIKAATTAELVAQRSPLGSGVAITRSPTSVTYDGSGRLSGSAATVRFEVYDGVSTYRCISLDPSGYPSTRIDRCP